MSSTYGPTSSSDWLPGTRLASRFALGGAAVSCLIGSAVLVGWCLDNDSLTSVQTSKVPMNPLTAMCIITLGACLALAHFYNSNEKCLSLARVGSMAVAGLAAGKLCCFFLGCDFWPDQFFFASKVITHSTGPNQMAPNTAMGFLMSGIAIWTLGSDRRLFSVAGRVLALTTVMFSLLANIGYLRGANAFYGLSEFIPMSFPTAIGFFALSCGTFSAFLTRSSLLDISRESGEGQSLQRKIIVGFTGALLILSTIGIASYASLTKLLSDARSNDHTYQVMVAISDLATDIRDAEIGAGRYLIFGDKSYLDLYECAIAEVPQSVAQVKSLTSDNPAQKDRVTTLDFIISKRLDNLQKFVDLRGSGRVESSQSQLLAAEGKRIMGNLRLVLAEMRQDEDRLLKRRSEEQASSAGVAMWVISIGSLACFLLVAVAGLMIRRDMIAREQAEQLLHESEQRYRFLADVMPQIIWTSSPDGQMEYFNSRWREFTGCPVEAAQEDSWRTVIHSDDLPDLLSQWDHARGAGDTFQAECRLLRKSDNVYRWFLCRAVPRCGQENEVVQWIGTLTDIHDRKVIEDDLQSAKSAADRASEAKSEFLAHVSHEIRTPLNGVIGMLDLLLGTGLNEQQTRYAKLSKSSAAALTALINDILDFSKIEAGKLELESTDFNLHLTVEDAMVMLAQKAAQKNLELACYIAPAVPALVRGDPDRLRQIVVNLVNNAIKFTTDGTITILVTAETIQDEAAFVRFAVVDTGIGIPADRMDRLFKSFSQVDASTTRVHGGTGLGLAISKQLVELMGGEIGAQSAFGKGSTFWFTAKLTVQPNESNEFAPVIDPRGLRVLAVDDNLANLEVLQQQLEAWGFQAAAAPDGMRALNVLCGAASAGTPFRVAIVDQDMPGMDGLELARQIKSKSDIRETVLMILATIKSDLDPRQLREMGFDGQMIKPVRQSQLFDAIMNALSSARQLTERVSRTSSALRQERQSRTPSSPRSAKILLAEDNEINLMVATEILARAGYHCDAVSDGQSAVEAARSGQYDLILMDCQMPLMDGFDASRQIRELESAAQLSGSPAKRIPIVALTANAIKGDRERCLDAGMDEYLTKPLDPQKLIQVINRLVSKTTPSVSESSAILDQSSDGDLQESATKHSNAVRERPPINLDFLNKQWGSDEGFVQTLLARFRTRAPMDLSEIEAAASGGDWQEVARIAHRLKGSSGYVAANAIGVICEKLEAAAAAGEEESIKELAEQLRLELDCCMAFITSTEAEHVS